MEKNFLVSTPVVVFQLVTEEKNPNLNLKKKKKGGKEWRTIPCTPIWLVLKLKQRKKPNFWTDPVSLHCLQQKEHIRTLVAFQPQIKLNLLWLKLI